MISEKNLKISLTLFRQLLSDFRKATKDFSDVVQVIIE